MTIMMTIGLVVDLVDVYHVAFHGQNEVGTLLLRKFRRCSLSTNTVSVFSGLLLNGAFTGASMSRSIHIVTREVSSLLGQ